MLPNKLNLPNSKAFQLWESAINSAKNGITISDALEVDLPLIYVNPAFEQITGYTSEEVLGKNCRFLQRDDRNQPELAELKKALAEQRFCNVVVRNYRKDGSLFWNELFISPIIDPAGHVTHFIGIQNDITAKVELEQKLRNSEEKYRVLVDNTHEGMWMVDKAGNTTFVNNRMCEMLGYTQDEMIGQHLFFFMDEAGKIEAEPKIERRRRGIREQHDFRFKHKNGNDVWTIVSTKPLLDSEGNYAGAMGLITDITTRKLVEAEVLVLNQELEQRVTERTAQLELANQELAEEIARREQLEGELRLSLEKEQELGKLRARFISMTSHEFRTPLSVILSYSEMLEYYGEHWTSEKRIESLHDIQKAIVHLTSMLDDILTVGKGESGTLEFNPTPHNLTNIFDQVLSEVMHSSNGKSEVRFFNTFEPDLVLVDEKLLRHILLNLLSNAIKYSPAGSPVDFSLSSEAGLIVIEVKDQGIGIPLEDHSHIYEPFHRAANVLTISGTGLGLAIVKRSVDLHGGEISFSSAPGEGTTFTVTLPLQIV